MRSLCLTVSRFALSAWVGAATLFVVTTLREVQSPNLTSPTKAHLAALRFPPYYALAFSLIGVALLCAMVGLRSAGRWRQVSAVSLIALALLLTTADYHWVYKPLEQMTAAAEQSRPANFVSYHHASKWINAVQVTVSMIAALTVCWPVSSDKP